MGRVKPLLEVVRDGHGGADGSDPKRTHVRQAQRANHGVAQLGTLLGWAVIFEKDFGGAVKQLQAPEALADGARTLDRHRLRQKRSPLGLLGTLALAVG